jgi:subtilisin family serine protease
MPFPPSVAWAKKFAANFHEVGEYLEAHHVRVVNMSWGDNQAEFAQWINHTVKNKSPEQRKALAAKVYAIWKQGIQSAIEAAPDTLWICAAGNSDNNASFAGFVPASLHESNLISVGAVDQAGQETSFTSYGGTVVLYSDGYQVPSHVPGGTVLKLSGTSMASPNVVNLAAKLIALDPKLTPKQTIALMEKGATASDHGRLHLIDPKASVALLKKEMAAK